MSSEPTAVIRRALDSILARSVFGVRRSCGALEWCSASLESSFSQDEIEGPEKF
ncbi:MAG: hypothetical protein WCN98_03820 [Verrucomicrobiaceae bacterium]